MLKEEHIQHELWGPNLQKQKWIQIISLFLFFTFVSFTLLTLPRDINSQSFMKRKAIKPVIQEMSLDDIFISVKTSQKFHDSRLKVILKTWFQLAKANTYFFTDISNNETSILTNGHMIETFCPPDHSRYGLSCKMQAELDMFLKSDKR